MPSDTLLVLDLDETLLHSRHRPLPQAENIRHDAFMRVGSFYTYARPGLAAFLQWAFQHHAVGVYTAASETYARLIIDAWFPQAPVFLKHGRHCTWRWSADETYQIPSKTLRKCRQKRWHPSRILVLDDNPLVWQRSYGNLVRVPEWDARHPDDQILTAVQPFLTWCFQHPDVRPVEKRHWLRCLPPTPTPHAFGY